MLRDLLDFLKSRAFLFNLLAMILLLFGMIYGVKAYLDHYTLHRETITVPDIKGGDTEEAKKVLSEQGLNAILKDSVHADDADPGEVIDQDPEAGEKVKDARNIYITIRTNAPEMVSVPRLTDRSRRQAESILKTVGLKISDFQFEADVCTDCVLEQRYKGEAIEAGERIPKGSALVLVLGKGKGEKKTEVPDLIGLTIEASQERLLDATLNLGAADYSEGCCPTKADSMNAKIYQQSPAADGEPSLKAGSTVDVWLTTDEERLKRAIADSSSGTSAP